VSTPHSDVLIVGCGPAGASAAWKLAKEGHTCTIVDKSTFPRDKVCGDALSGKAITLLRRFDPQAVQRLLATGTAEPIWGIRFVAPNGKPIEVPFQDPLPDDPEHNAGAVRAYMDGVTGFHPDGYIELHFLKEYLPGYFWAFPLPNGQSNIGLGMRSDKLKERGLSLRDEMQRIIDRHPLLGERFEGATLQEKIVGYPLPLGSKLRRASGEGYMILGDAGHMIDPLTGEGIGNGMYAGIIAAEQAIVSLRENNLSADALSAYDVRIARVLGREMDISRAQVAKPSFWLKAAMGKNF